MSWLDALALDGRIVLPFTAAMPAMGSIGKGVMTLFTKSESGEFAGRALSFVAIYSGVGLRDERLNVKLGEAMQRMPMPPLKRLRRDAHEPAPQCWLHAEQFCLST